MNAFIAPRLRACAVGVGGKMLVWGGVDATGEPLGAGVLYDPIHDTRESISTDAAPAPRELPTCMAVGENALVWGGRDPVAGTLLNDGAIYDVSLDTWEALPTDDAPIGRLWPATAWTGSRAIVWGGDDGSGKQVKTGAMYDVALRKWTPITADGAPPSNNRMTSAWTGGTMLVFGGRADDGDVEMATFGFAPIPNLWAAEVNALSPPGRSNAFGAWTGSAFLVWGGLNTVKWALGDGGLYDPNTKSWTYLVAETASSTRATIPYETGWSAWIGSKFVIMGGSDGISTIYEDGVMLDPDAPLGSRWTDIPAWTPPGSHQYGVGVWTGEEFIIWGGSDGSSPMVDGSRWMP